MRISDWSSDVCSSDLLEGHRYDGGRQHHHAQRHQRRGDDQVDDEEGQKDQEADLERGLELAGDEGGQQDREGDRKSGVWGKSVSVRVDLVGRRIYKQKKTDEERKKMVNAPSKQ